MDLPMAFSGGPPNGILLLRSVVMNSADGFPEDAFKELFVEALESVNMTGIKVSVSDDAIEVARKAR